MFFVLSKILHFLLTPILWIILALLGGLLFKNLKWKKRSLVLAAFMLLFFTNPWILNSVMKWWEYQAIPYNQLENHDVGILLTGVTRPNNEPKDRVYFNKGADRVTHTIQLYRLGKIKHILVSGGSGLLINNSKDVESENIRQVLLLCGIPDSVITIEDQSRNTRETAVFSKKILDKKFPGRKYLLVTSAFHMRRSVACFEKAAIKATPFAVDFLTEDLNFRFIYLFPSEFSLLDWRILLREVFGMISYKIAGYI